MRFDFIETIKSLSTATRRSKWMLRFRDERTNEESEPTACYTDDALKKLSDDWDNVSPLIKTQMLVPILLLRTSDTLIDGERIMLNYLERLVELKDGEILYTQIMNEIEKRERILNEHFQRMGGGTTRYILGRWLSYSSWVIRREWNTCGHDDPHWWDGFSLDDACEFERGRCLVEMLKSRRNAGKKTIIFAFVVFHQQFAARVVPFQAPAHMTGVTITPFQKCCIHCDGRKCNGGTTIVQEIY